MTVDSQNHYGIQAMQAKSYVSFPVSAYGPGVGFTTGLVLTVQEMARNNV